MTTNRTRFLLAPFLLLCLMLFIGWFAGLFDARVDPALLKSPLAIIAEDHLFRAQEVSVEATELIPGSVSARDNTVISSRILARVRSVSVRPGDTVKVGQLLVELEQDDMLTRVSQAQEQVSSAAARVEESRLQRDRVQELLDRGLAAQADLDTAVASYDSLTAQLGSVSDALEGAQVQLTYSNIRAPIPGRIVERFVNPGDTSIPGRPLLTLYDPLSIRAESNVREGLALKLNVGQKIRVEIPSLGQILNSTIEEIVPAAEPASRSFLVKASMTYNPSLMPGMFARFIVPVGTQTTILIPSASITRVGELDMVTTYKDGVSQRRFLRLGKLYPNDMVSVTAGLEPGEVIVIKTEESYARSNGT
jgi:RND family efflux transporter MFP subunit